MKLGEFRDLTASLPDDILVVQARDPEGNGYAPVYEVEVGKYLSDRYECRMIHPDDVPDYHDLFDAVCIWPAH